MKLFPSGMNSGRDNVHQAYTNLVAKLGSGAQFEPYLFFVPF